MGPGILDQLVQTFVGRAAAWEGALAHIAVGLFVALAAIEVALALGFAFARGAQLTDFLALMVQQTVTLGFFYFMMTNWAKFAKAIVDSFAQAGNAASQAGGGTSNLTPTGIFKAGINMSHHIWNGLSWDHPLLGILLIVAGVVVICVFAVICGMMVEVLVESAIVAYAGIIMMGFGGSVYTREYAIGQIRYAIAVGAKRFMLQLMVGLGEGLVVGWSNGITTGATDLTWETIAILIGAPIVLLRLTTKIPQMAQDMVLGSHSHTYGGIGSTAAAVGGAAVGAAAAVTGAGAATGAAVRLAQRQIAERVSAGQAPPNRITQAAMMTGYAARNFGASMANDVGRRLTGQYTGAHGYRGWRMAADMNRQARPKSLPQSQQRNSRP